MCIQGLGDRLGGFAFGGVGWLRWRRVVLLLGALGALGALVLLGSGVGGWGLVILLLGASGGLWWVCCAVCCGGCVQNHWSCLVVSPCLCRLPANHLPD